MLVKLTKTKEHSIKEYTKKIYKHYAYYNTTVPIINFSWKLKQTNKKSSITNH